MSKIVRVAVAQIAPEFLNQVKTRENRFISPVGQVVFLI